MQTVGFIGMGLMGIPMCRRLLAENIDLWVYNRTSSKCSALVEEGAKHAQDYVSLLQHVDIIMLCISDTDAVESVLEAIMPKLKSGQIIIDFSSIDPASTRQFAQKIQPLGAHWLDAPVSGGVAGAETGSLAIMVGGEHEVLEKVKPLLSMLGQRVTHMGPVGSGQTSKICNQMLVSCNVLVMAEVMAMAKKAGVDAVQLPQALAGGFADSIPLQLTGPRMAKQEFEEIKWRVKTLLKDLDMANVLAKQVDSAVPMVGLGAELMRQHASRGHGDEDPATLVTLYEANRN